MFVLNLSLLLVNGVLKYTGKYFFVPRRRHHTACLIMYKTILLEPNVQDTVVGRDVVPN